MVHPEFGDRVYAQLNTCATLHLNLIQFIVWHKMLDWLTIYYDPACVSQKTQRDIRDYYILPRLIVHNA